VGVLMVEPTEFSEPSVLLYWVARRNTSSMWLGARCFCRWQSGWGVVLVTTAIYRRNLKEELNYAYIRPLGLYGLF
jgi:hypothetical protein